MKQECLQPLAKEFFHYFGDDGLKIRLKIVPAIVSSRLDAEVVTIVTTKESLIISRDGESRK